MLTPAELHALQHELAGRNVLSVYLDAGVTDPAMRDTWRPVLQNALREARSRLDDERERLEFDRAAQFLQTPQPAPGGTWRAPGWVAFVTAEEQGLRCSEYLVKNPPIPPKRIVLALNYDDISPIGIPEET